MVNSDVSDVRETQDSNFFYFCSNMVDTVKQARLVREGGSGLFGDFFDWRFGKNRVTILCWTCIGCQSIGRDGFTEWVGQGKEDFLFIFECRNGDMRGDICEYEQSSKTVDRERVRVG